MTIKRVFGLSVLLTAIALSGGCSTLKSTNDTQASTPDSGTTNPSNPGADVSVGSAGTGAGLQGEALASDATADAAGKANQAAIGAGISVVHFPYDSDALSQDDMDLLRKHAAFLKANPSRQARLEGHTDERGTQEYNLALGERRGKAVAVFLQSQGVNPQQFEVVSFGELKPVAEGEDEAAWAKNRRVEIVYR